MAFLESGGVALPDPVSIKIDDEIIWTSDTGRTMSGLFVGEIVATKKNVAIKWEFLQEKEVALLSNRMIAGYFPLTFRDEGLIITIDAYRGTLSKEPIGFLTDGIYWYRSVSTSTIQR